MSYIAGHAEYRYPLAGDDPPERSDAKVLLLTAGGICTIGHWDGNPHFIAWSPMPKRDKLKEEKIHEAHRKVQ